MSVARAVFLLRSDSVPVNQIIRGREKLLVDFKVRSYIDAIEIYEAYRRVIHATSVSFAADIVPAS